MPKAVLNSRSRRNHRGLSNSRNHLARRDVYHRRLRCEPLEDRCLLSIGAAPELPGMHLVDPNLDNLRGQIIYLDFDGAKGVDYNGPVVVRNIDVPAFQSPDTLVGQEQAIIAAVRSHLTSTFADSGVVFTTVPPSEGTACSTIYVGGDDGAFRSCGSFLGLAESVDVGNVVRGDEAFVFSQSLVSPGISVEAYSKTVSEIVSHEVGHLVGYRHDAITIPGGASLTDHTLFLLRDVAAVAADITVNSITGVVAGSTVTIPFTLKNTGTTTQTFGVGGEIRSGDTVVASLGSKTTSTLAPNAVYNGSFTYLNFRRFQGGQAARFR